MVVFHKAETEGEDEWYKHSMGSLFPELLA